MLTAVMQELCDLVSDLSCDYSTNSVTELEIDLHRARESLDRMTKDLEEKNEELKRRSETIMELTSRVRIERLAKLYSKTVLLTTSLFV